jgi:hypothetical protein
LAARRLAAIDPTRVGPGGLRLHLELALLEAAPVSDRAATAGSAMPARASSDAAAGQPSSDAAAGLATSPASSVAPADPVAPKTPSAAPARAPATPDLPAEVTPPVPQAAPGDEAGDEVAATPDGDLDRLRHGWAEVVATIGRNPAVKPLITACRPIGVEGSVVTLGFPEEKSFLRDVAERRRPILEQYIGGFLGHDVGVRCIATNLDLLPPLPDDQEAAGILAEAHRIFADDRLDIPEVS